MAYAYSRSPTAFLIGPQDTGSVTSSASLDSAFVFETSGDAFCARFVAPVSQTSSTLTFYAFVTAVTGSPSFQIEVREGYGGTGDIDRPKTGGSNIGSSSSTVSSPSANTWVSWTVTCSLTAGDVYWIVVKNTHGTPASNHAQFQYRGSLDGLTTHSPLSAYIQIGGYTLDGFSTDPTLNTGASGTWVVKFSDGSLLGFPFVSTSNHSNNSNNRGNRWTFTEDVVISGIVTPLSNSNISGIAIYQNGSTILTEAGDSSSPTRGVYRFAPTTLTGGVAYDIVVTFSGNSTQGTFYTMFGTGGDEASTPTDVKACMPSCIVGSVDSATSSFTPNTAQVQLMALIIDDNPAQPSRRSGTS